MPPTISYTSRDFDTIMTALRNHLQTRFPTTWRNFYESGIGTAWMELVAYTFDSLSFYLDVAANENFLPTAQDRASVIRIGRALGYRLRGPTGASVTCQAVPEGGPYGAEVIVPANTVITSDSGVPYLTVEEQRISAGASEALPGALVFSQGEARTETFAAPGTSWWRQQLQPSDIVEGSLVVTVDGEEWEELSSLVFANEDSQAYQWERDADGYITLQFGDGVNGMAPAAAAAVVVTYRVGGGVVGNIYTGDVNATVIGELAGAPPPAPINVLATNPDTRGSGGEEPETTAHAKLWIPRFVAANGRAVTERDFDTLAQAFSDPVYGSPAFAKARLKQEIPELNTVIVALWSRAPDGSLALPSLGLKDAVQAYFSNNGAGAVRVICTDVEVEDGELVYLDVEVTATLAASFAAADVVSSVTAALDAILQGDVQQPGADVRLSHLYDAIQDSAGVHHALIDDITASSLSREAIGLGDGAETIFDAVLGLEPNLPVVAGTILVEAGTLVLTDQGDGTLAGDGTGTVDYDTGVVHLVFSAPVVDGIIVYVSYRHVLDTQRGGVEMAADGITRRLVGEVQYPPIVPYDPATGEKGIAITDGSQVAIDDGEGNLVGADVDPAGVNRIDYTTGSFDVTFLALPAADTEIRSTYRQRLQTPCEDIPIGKEQIAIKGTYSIATSEAEE